MHLFRRLLETARNRRTFRPRPAQRAGRLAELRTADLLAQRLDQTPLEVHASRRIPDHVTGRRREFDFLITSTEELVDIGGPTDGLIHIGNVDSWHTSQAELFRRFDEGDVVDVRITGLRPDEDEINLHLVHHNPSL